MGGVEALGSAEEVEALLVRLLGSAPPRDGGVVHVTSVWESGDGSLRTLRIGQDTPKSPHDHFLLQATRARADAIVVTGKVLRDEPTLRYALDGPGRSGAALDAYRVRRMGRPEAPRLLVLSRRDDLDLGHPALHGWPSASVVTDEATAASLRTRAPTDVEIVALAEPGLATAIAHARGSLGARTVALEVGPSLSVGLYASPLGVDELVLAIYRGTPSSHVVGGALPPLAVLARLFGQRPRPCRVEEASGPWDFLRLVRRPPPAQAT